jgi:hypothetical protein
VDPFVDLLTETASRIRAKTAILTLIQAVDPSQLGNVSMSNSLVATAFGV